jgi:proton glutamate symport protein
MTRNLPDEQFSSARKAIVALLAGLLVGLAINQWPARILVLTMELLEPIGALWLSALQMLVLPLMISMLLVAIGRARPGQAGRMGFTTVLCFVIFLGVASLLTVIVGVALLDWFPVGEDIRAAFQLNHLVAESSPLSERGEAIQPQIRDWFVGIVPKNLVHAAASGDLMSLIVASVLFGVALRYVPDKQQTTLLNGAEAISQWCLALAGLLFRFLPLAVFVLTMNSAAASGTDLASGLAYYIFLVCALLILTILILYPVTVHYGAISLKKFASAIWPVQLLAFSTRSSVACLPAMETTSKNSLGLRAGVPEFVLPLAVSSFKINMGVSAIFQLVFLLHLYGIEPPPVSYMLAVIALAAQSVVTPGLPSGAIWTTTPLYLSLGIPLEGIVLINVVDTIPDLFQTTANVTADLSVATIVSHSSR